MEGGLRTTEGGRSPSSRDDKNTFLPVDIEKFG
jgi:hypothetical protein